MKYSDKKITYSGKDIVKVLKELEIILRSLHNSGSYYAVKFHEEGENLHKKAYQEETTAIIDDWSVTKRLSKIRRILSEKIDDLYDEDELDLLEEEMESLEYWRKPGNKPKNT